MLAVVLAYFGTTIYAAPVLGTVCGLTHRQSYLDLGAVTLLIPLSIVFSSTLLLSLAL